MKSFRNPKYLERYVDVVFDLEQALDIDPNDAHYQKREVTPGPDHPPNLSSGRDKKGINKHFFKSIEHFFTKVGK